MSPAEPPGVGGWTRRAVLALLQLPVLAWLAPKAAARPMPRPPAKARVFEAGVFEPGVFD